MTSEGGEGGASLGLVIFFAILLHKIPASIGLGTFLCSCNLPKHSTMYHMLSFTGTSPLSNIIVFILLINLELEAYLEQLQFWVGVLLVFSGGTFLYVATIHILPEVFFNSKKAGLNEDKRDDYH